MSGPQTFLLALIVIYAAPYLAWKALGGGRLFPLVVVQIVTGVLLGPGVLGAAAPRAYAFLFNPAAVQALGGVAMWAVILFVWSAGVELDLSRAWANRREAGTTAALALGAPLVLGAAAAALLMWATPGWTGPKGAPWQAVLGIGMACAVTALPILVLLLEQLELLHTSLGQRILSFASLDDLAVWAVLAAILLDWRRIGAQVAFLILFGAASWLMRRLLRRLGEADRGFVSLIWLAACAFAADWAGLHFMVGAFLAGAVIEPSTFSRARLDGFRNTVLLTLMPVFFLSTGLRTRFGVDGWLVVAAAALLLAAAVGGKLAGVSLAGRWLSWSRREGRLIGWLLQTKALIMIVFADVLLDRGVISARAFTALLLMGVASTMLTLPMARRDVSALARA